MVYPIPAISPGAIQAARPTTGAIAAPGVDNQDNPTFASAVGNAIDQLAAADDQAAQAAQAAATGDVASVGEFMVAATEAQLTTELTVAVRNRAVEAFNDIMRMQI